MSGILLLHGPNLNLLGKREPEIYGSMTLGEINQRVLIAGQEMGFDIQAFQSNREGALIDRLQEAIDWASGAIFNPGGYSHTSIALRDTIAAIELPVVEVHLTNIYGREDFRQRSLIAPVCAGTITGFGWRSYLLALQALRGLIDGDKP